MKQIHITIDVNGAVEIKAEGFAGKACKEATAFIEGALGSAVSRTFTPAYYQNKTERRIQQNRENTV